MTLDPSKHTSQSAIMPTWISWCRPFPYTDLNAFVLHRLFPTIRTVIVGIAVGASPSVRGRVDGESSLSLVFLETEWRCGGANNIDPSNRLITSTRLKYNRCGIRVATFRRDIDELKNRFESCRMSWDWVARVATVAAEQGR